MAVEPQTINRGELGVVARPGIPAPEAGCCVNLWAEKQLAYWTGELRAEEDVHAKTVSVLAKRAEELKTKPVYAKVPAR